MLRSVWNAEFSFHFWIVSDVKNGSAFAVLNHLGDAVDRHDFIARIRQRASRWRRRERLWLTVPHRTLHLGEFATRTIAEHEVRRAPARADVVRHQNRHIRSTLCILQREPL